MQVTRYITYPCVEIPSENTVTGSFLKSERSAVQFFVERRFHTFGAVCIRWVNSADIEIFWSRDMILKVNPENRVVDRFSVRRKKELWVNKYVQLELNDPHILWIYFLLTHRSAEYSDQLGWLVFFLVANCKFSTEGRKTLICWNKGFFFFQNSAYFAFRFSKLWHYDDQFSRSL